MPLGLRAFTLEVAVAGEGSGDFVDVSRGVLADGPHCFRAGEVLTSRLSMVPSLRA